MHRPRVSVLVTTYNHAAFVREALDSLILQSYRDFEIIITDDASSDGTPDLIDAWLRETRSPARFLRNAVNRGISANRNTALSLASGEFVCSLSGDDAYEPERIARQVKHFLEQTADVAVVYSDMRMIDAQGRDLQISFLDYGLGGEAPPANAIFARLLRGCFLPAPAAMIRRSCLDVVGAYDETLYFEDYDMWLRLSEMFQFHFLPGCLVRYRVLPTSMSRSPATRRAMLLGTLQVLKSWEDKVGGAPLLWNIGRRQIHLHLDSQGLISLAASARILGLRNRLIARVLRVPGACSAARAIFWIFHLRHVLRFQWYSQRVRLHRGTR